MSDDDRKDAEKNEGGRNVGALVLAGLIGVFAIANFDEVEVNWVVGKSDTPLIIVIGVAVLLGAGIGWLLGRRRD